MNDKQKECLQANQDYFAENMVDVMKVCDHLLAKGDLTRNMVEEIRGINRTHTEQVRAFLTKIPTRTGNAFLNLHYALQKSGNGGLAERLVSCLLPDVPTGEDSVDAGDVAMADQAIKGNGHGPAGRPKVNQPVSSK